jgi:hypothetical protein
LLMTKMSWPSSRKAPLVTYWAFIAITLSHHQFRLLNELNFPSDNLMKPLILNITLLFADSSFNRCPK